MCRCSAARTVPRTIVARTVFQFAPSERLQKRRDVHRKSSAVPIPEAIPTTNRVRRVAGPCLHTALGRRALFVGPTEVDPISARHQHLLEVIDASRIVMQDRLADGTHQDLPTGKFPEVHRVSRRPRRRGEMPRVPRITCLITRKRP